ncbi:RNA polymerase factor sigma-54 [Nitrosomonas sp. Is37]|uniref:RNA polymerase factor sigma-54 n=1 Tax=Nitrosomonas sp. Is37 TaxID=3080535 RepID=UPI00294B2753|nr:RNA polymerase factor sigma-54 [Nitrosomonas sp. Is37]MDV6343892.1 RNA polymerase factor sigma-54 [Nitrosomonas sp. Is37]
MKPTLHLKLTASLKLTPQLQQSIRLLQLSTIELNQEIERIVQNNPLLELSDGTDYEQVSAEGFSNSLSSDITSSSVESNSAQHPEKDEGELILPSNEDTHWLGDHETFSSHRESDEDEWDFTQQMINPPNLREHLIMQISLSQISERDRQIVGILIDSLDDDGYLMQDLQELLEMLPVELGIHLEDLQAALKYLQQLDPPGIGARNLQECLLLQLQALPEETPYRQKAILLVEHDLETLASKDFKQIRKLLHCDDDCLRSVQQLITQLNPKPGSTFNSTVSRYVIPDVIVTKLKGTWLAKLNPESIPRLSINQLYADILKRDRNDSTQMLMSQLNEAKWMLKNIQQRSETIFRVSTMIVEHQQAFFEHGAVAMRPLVMREIAEALNLHESTVSRVTTQKFMHTPHGIFELKYFFGSHVATDSGGACSAIAIRTLIKQLIQDEDQKRPLTDNRISEILAEQGIIVARRTVAKYREAMHIPPTNLRKML